MITMTSFFMMQVLHFCCLTMLGTSSNSTDSNERPEVSYPGTLIERSSEGGPIRVINIAIGKVQETSRVIAYEKPSDPAIKPQNLTVELNLRDVAVIQVPSPESIVFDKRPYTEIVVTYRSLPGSAKSVDKHLIIEESTFLFCDTDEQRPMAKRVLLKAIKKLTIDEGQIPVQRVRDNHKSLQEREQKRSQACSEVADHLQSLQQESDNLPSSQRQKVTGIIDQIKNWLGQLCGM